MQYTYMYKINKNTCCLMMPIEIYMYMYYNNIINKRKTGQAKGENEVAARRTGDTNITPGKGKQSTTGDEIGLRPAGACSRSQEART